MCCSAPVFGSQVALAQSARIGQSALQKRQQIGLSQRFEAKKSAARKQRRVDAGQRIFRRRADQNHGAVFDVRQKRVLLRAVETVDFIDEKQRASTRAAALNLQPFFRRRDDAPHIGDAARHRRKIFKVRVAAPRDETRQRGFAAARRPEKQARRRASRFDHAAQRRARLHQMRLPDELVEIARPHARRQRTRKINRVVAFRITASTRSRVFFGKKIHGASKSLNHQDTKDTKNGKRKETTRVLANYFRRFFFSRRSWCSLCLGGSNSEKRKRRRKLGSSLRRESAEIAPPRRASSSF